jgi:NSS family neurotransmitter:Na+ symporter
MSDSGRKSNNNIFWSSKLTFILAASGCAVGLGNIWRFPYLVGKHGGGTFILLYLLFAFLIAGSILLAEFVLGRYLQNPILDNLKTKLKTNQLIKLILGFSLFIPSIILTFYFVVTGWLVYYIYSSVTGAISYSGQSPEYYGNIFGNLLGAPIIMMICAAIFILITLIINFKGLIAGVEKTNLYLLPLLFVLLIILVIRVASIEGVSSGFLKVMQINPSSINSEMLVDALGQAFFSFSIGAGVMMTFASFAKLEYNLKQVAISTVLIDSAVGIFSALMVIPATVAFGFDLNGGPGLTFITLPTIFSYIPFGAIIATIFFITMALAALTSTITMVEPAIILLQKLFKSTRNQALLILAAYYFITVSIQILSFNELSWFKIFGKNTFDLMDFTTNLLMIITALTIAIVVGFILDKNDIYKNVTSNNTIVFKGFNIWYYSIKYLAPIVIILILINFIIS